MTKKFCHNNILCLHENEYEKVNSSFINRNHWLLTTIKQKIALFVYHLKQAKFYIPQHNIFWWMQIELLQSIGMWVLKFSFINIEKITYKMYKSKTNCIFHIYFPHLNAIYVLMSWIYFYSQCILWQTPYGTPYQIPKWHHGFMSKSFQ